MQITDRLPLVVIESPYKGDVPRNEAFARAIMRWAIDRGFSPYAMHLLYTQVLDDTVAVERAAGISCGLSWTRMANEVWYCLRPGEEVTSGMQLAIDRDQKRVAAGEPLVARHLRFTQAGDLVAGWEGPLPAHVFAPDVPAVLELPHASASAASSVLRAATIPAHATPARRSPR